MSTSYRAHHLRKEGAYPLPKNTWEVRRKAPAVWRTSARRYMIAAVLCAVFSGVYEHFSHGVWSLWMVGLGAWPLVLGVIPALVCGIGRVSVCKPARDLWACGVATLAMGSCLRGVLEIYGTTSELVEPYLPVGVALLVLGAIACVVGGVRASRARRRELALSRRL